MASVANLLPNPGWYLYGSVVVGSVVNGPLADAPANGDAIGAIIALVKWKCPESVMMMVMTSCLKFLG